MKKIMTLLLLMLFTATAYTQTNANEAKAAYLLAEESYGKGDYKTAIEYLQQVKTALGTTNCKILYLEIMATRELYAKNPKAYGKVFALIEQFEKSPDYADFNEEKTLEVSKLKLSLRTEQKLLIEEENKPDPVQVALGEYFDKEVKKCGPFNLTLEQLDSARPQWKVKEWNVYPTSDSVVIYYPKSFKLTESNFPFAKYKGYLAANAITGIVFRNGKLFTYQFEVLNFDSESKSLVDSYKATVDAGNSMMELWSKLIKKPPVNQTFTSDGHSVQRRSWTRGRYQLTYDYMTYPRGNAGVVKMVEWISFYPPATR